jgi:hypothetical protein
MLHWKSYLVIAPEVFPPFGRMPQVSHEFPPVFCKDPPSSEHILRSVIFRFFPPSCYD